MADPINARKAIANMQILATQLADLTSVSHSLDKNRNKPLPINMRSGGATEGRSGVVRAISGFHFPTRYEWVDARRVKYDHC